MKLDVGGHLKVQGENEIKQVPISVNADFGYQQRQMSGNQYQVGGLRGARYYESVEATVKIDQGGFIPTIRNERRLIGVDCERSGRATLFSPSGPLTREELDLIEVPGNSEVVYTLLPAEAVAIGGTWDVSCEAMAALLGLDNCSHTDVKGKLLSVEKGYGKLEYSGAVDGAVTGVATEIQFKAKALIELSSKRLTSFSLAVKESRSIGPVSPGLEVVARVTLSFEPLKTSAYLSDRALSGVSFSPNEAVTKLEYESAGTFRFYYDRRWYIVRDDQQGLAMKLMDGTQSLAHLHVGTIARSDRNSQLSIDQFKKQVQEGVGDAYKETLEDAPAETDGKHSLYRLSIVGEVSDVPIQWYYFLASDSQGHQLLLTFTLNAADVEPFNGQDWAIAGTLELLHPKSDPNQRPTPARAAAREAEKSRK